MTIGKYNCSSNSPSAELSSLSGKTDFLVAEESPGSKYRKAEGLGVKILREEKFMEMIKQLRVFT